MDRGNGCGRSFPSPRTRSPTISLLPTSHLPLPPDSQISTSTSRKTFPPKNSCGMHLTSSPVHNSPQPGGDSPPSKEPHRHAVTQKALAHACIHPWTLAQTFTRAHTHILTRLAADQEVRFNADLVDVMVLGCLVGSDCHHQGRPILQPCDSLVRLMAAVVRGAGGRGNGGDEIGVGRGECRGGRRRGEGVQEMDWEGGRGRGAAVWVTNKGQPKFRNSKPGGAVHSRAARH